MTLKRLLAPFLALAFVLAPLAASAQGIDNIARGLALRGLPKAGGTMTGPVLGALGTVAAPGYAFAGFPGTGWYSTGSGMIGFAAAGVLKLDYSITSGNQWTFVGALKPTNGILSSGSIEAGSASYLGWNSGTIITSPADGVWLPQKNAGSAAQMTVAALPTCNAATRGARAFVTDANATTFLSSVAAGGANGVPVVCDATAWKIG